ncbi:hypothetical protein M758_UG311600 [Ceratodon purpureus]|nr:hypothetical protein M758_UG311600 [Ceratodon purpureus]
MDSSATAPDEETRSSEVSVGGIGATRGNRSTPVSTFVFRSGEENAEDPWHDMPALEPPPEDHAKPEWVIAFRKENEDREDPCHDMPALEPTTPERRRKATPMVRFTTPEEETGDPWYDMPSIAEVFQFGPEHFGMPIPYHVHVAEVNASVLTSLLLLKVGEVQGIPWAESQTVWDRLFGMLFNNFMIDDSEDVE